MNAPRMKMIFLALLAAVFLAACGGDTEIPVTQDLDVAPASTQVPATDQQESTEPVDDADSSADESGSQESVAQDLMRITFGGEEMTFEPIVCAALAPEFMSVTGLPLGDTPTETEFGLSYQLPMLGDGDNSEYDNTVTLTFGNDSWKAGTLENSVGEQSWGELDWTREGDTVIGTAVMVHSWGLDSENSEPREASFEVSCG